MTLTAETNKMSGTAGKNGPKQLDRLALVQRITELNSRHLKSEGHRAGLELEIASCEAALMRGDASEDSEALLRELRLKLTAVDDARREIDLERQRLAEALRQADLPARDG